MLQITLNKNLENEFVYSFPYIVNFKPDNEDVYFQCYQQFEKNIQQIFLLSTINLKKSFTQEDFNKINLSTLYYYIKDLEIQNIIINDPEKSGSPFSLSAFQTSKRVTLKQFLREENNSLFLENILVFEIEYTD